MEISEEAARRIYSARSCKNAPRGHFPAYYLMRLEHPAVLELYRSWCKERGILPGMPPGDAQRIQFELSLLQPEVVEQLLEYAGWVEDQRERIGAELLDQHRKIAAPLDRTDQRGREKR